MRRLVLALLLAPPLLAPRLPAQQPARLGLVDPLVGTTNGGNTTPGAETPFGFISLGPDTTNADHGFTNGYNPAADITGFSYTHVSGTGGEGKYGNFRVTPTVGEPAPANLLFPWTAERATPGYYAVTLGSAADSTHPDEQVRTEHTATRLVGLSRYTFPAHTTGNLLLDVTSRLRMVGGRSGVSSVPMYATAAAVTITSPRTVEGFATITGGWNPAPYTLYFAASLDRDASSSGLWQQHGADEPQLLPGATHCCATGEFDGSQVAHGPEDYRNELGAYFRFDTSSSRTVEMRLAVSFVSVEQARRNLAAADSLSFAAARAAAAADWQLVLDTIDVSGGTPAQQSIFYTALYRAHLMPHDLTGENIWCLDANGHSQQRRCDPAAPHYEDYYTLWDTFRTLHPLFTLTEPARQTGMVNSLLQDYQLTGWLPDARIAGANGLTQGGSNGDILLADALVKHLPGIDAQLAWEAVDKDATVSVAPEDAFNEGRELGEWNRLGYMALDQQRSASRTLDYAAEDYSVATIAHLLGRSADAEHFLQTSTRWQSLWDDQLQCIRPRFPSGDFQPHFRCDHLVPDGTTLWWDAPFYEGSSTQYSTYVPQDLPGLIAKLGGPTPATAWLDHLFTHDNYTQGNEPDILAPWTYIYLGRQDLTALRVRHILATDYTTGRGGLPGNDDAGTMSSWYILSAIGLYPLAGQPLYFIGSPLFTSSTVHLGQSGRTFTIAAPATSAANLYVQSAQLNGQPLHRAWLTHAEVEAGGTLTLQMGPHPVHWDKILPPNGQAAWSLISPQ